MMFMVAFRSAKVRLVNALLRSKRRQMWLSEALAQPRGFSSLTAP